MTSENLDQKMALAVALHQQDQFPQAEAAYLDILHHEPNYYPALLYLGLLYGDAQNFETAVDLLQRAVLLQPQSVDVHYNLGLYLFYLRRFETAACEADLVLSMDPHHFAALYLRGGLIAYETKKFEEALFYLNKALAVDADEMGALNGLGLTLIQLKRSEEALVIFEKALMLYPATPILLHNKCVALINLKRNSDIVATLDEILIIEPDNVKALTAKANEMVGFRRINDAIECYQKAITIDAKHNLARSELLYHLLCVCKWGELELYLIPLLDAVVRTSAGENDTIMPLIGHTLFGLTSEDHYNFSRRHAVHLSEEMEPLKNKLSFSFLKKNNKKLKIGYFSNDFRVHPLGQLIPEVLELHNRERFTIYAYSYGPNDKSAMRKRIEKAADYFFDIENDNEEAIATKIHNDEIDILIDLTGYSWASRTQLLALRPAPIQVSYLGYLGTMAADFIDAIIADQFVIPPESQRYYSEKVYYLPCYQANDRQCAVAKKPSRADCGLPEDAFVFCCFNQTFKITHEVFNVWCKLLQQVPNSVLWLLASNRWAVENLREQLQKCDINPDRIIFANIVPLHEHLGRLQCADVVLDTYPYNAGTTASNALWVGVPIVTYAGETFPSRMAGSLLTALEVPELITYHLDDYYQLALTLATNDEKRKAITDKIKANRDSSILFNTPFLVQHLEDIYQQMWNDYIKK
jgi:predicted O-linked N-acetylglucosamine transferase (SPINDLY family)